MRVRSVLKHGNLRNLLVIPEQEKINLTILAIMLGKPIHNDILIGFPIVS
jgi:hypothetical protein